MTFPLHFTENHSFSFSMLPRDLFSQYIIEIPLTSFIHRNSDNVYIYILIMIKMLATEIYKDDGAMFDCLVRCGMTMVF